MDGQIKYIGEAARHTPEDPNGFDLKLLLLARGTEINEADPLTVAVDLLGEIAPEYRDWAEQQVNDPVAKFTLDNSQIEAWNAAARRVVGGVLLIQGPPGTGKTRINACIAVSLAMIGHTSTLAAGSNRAADALALGIIKMLKQYPEFEENFEVVRYNTPYTTKRTLEEDEPSADVNEPKRIGQRRAMLAVPDLLRQTETQNEEDLLLQPYKVANRIKRYAAGNPEDPVCARWVWLLKAV